MDSLTLKVPVTVKSIVTDQLKQQIAREVQDAIKKLELEIQHLEFQGKRTLVELEKQNPQQLPKVKQQFEAEKTKRIETRQKLLDKLKDIGRLELGSEVFQGTMEGFIEVKMGTSWNEAMSSELLLLDGKVVEIRTRKLSTELCSDIREISKQLND